MSAVGTSPGELRAIPPDSAPSLFSVSAPEDKWPFANFDDSRGKSLDLMSHISYLVSPRLSVESSKMTESQDPLARFASLQPLQEHQERSIDSGCVLLSHAMARACQGSCMELGDHLRHTLDLFAHTGNLE